jgi:hypothetical protein
MYVCVCVCVYVCMYVCMYVCVQICEYTMEGRILLSAFMFLLQNYLADFD